MNKVICDIYEFNLIDKHSISKHINNYYNLYIIVISLLIQYDIDIYIYIYIYQIIENNPILLSLLNHILFPKYLI